MSEPAVEIGDKLHIVTRRRFESDVRRHFVGELVGISGDLHSVRGFAFVFNPVTNGFSRRREPRTRALSLGQEGFIVNKIPREIDIASLEYQVMDKRLVITDGRAFALDINEFGPSF